MTVVSPRYPQAVPRTTLLGPGNGGIVLAIGVLLLLGAVALVAGGVGCVASTAEREDATWLPTA